MPDVLKFRNARGEFVELEAVAATRLKNEPASIIDRVAAGKAVAITRHNTTRAVILSYDDFRELALAREPALGALSAQFDRLLAGMQTPDARKALETAFTSSAEELGQSAVEAAAVEKKRPPRTAASKRVSRRSRTRGGR